MRKEEKNLIHCKMDVHRHEKIKKTKYEKSILKIYIFQGIIFIYVHNLFKNNYIAREIIYQNQILNLLQARESKLMTMLFFFCMLHEMKK